MASDFDARVERARAVSIESEVARRHIVLRRSGAERIGPCPKCGGTDRFSINPKEGVWNCRGCKPSTIAGDVIGLVEFLDGVEFGKAVETLAGMPAASNGKGNGHAPPAAKDKDKPPGPIVATYDYVDESGSLLFQVTRHEPKDFRQRRRARADDEPWRVHDGWVGSIKDVRQVPYRLPELVDAIGQGFMVFVVEGEKDADAWAGLGQPASCNAGGAGKWSDALDEYFRDADVVVIADNDPQARNKKTGELLFHEDGRPRFPGQDHARAVCAHLAPVAARVRYLDLKTIWPECPAKGDSSDWLARGGGTRERVIEIIDQLPDWSPDMPGPQPEQDLPKLTFIDTRAWDGVPVPQRRWLIRDSIPSRNVTLLSGEGGVGKTLLAQQLAVSTVLARDWIGFMPEPLGPGPVMLLSAEDDEDEIHFRLDKIVAHHGARFRDLGALHVLSLAGRDSVLATFGPDGIIKPTLLYKAFAKKAREVRPRWIGIDTAADVFVMDERDRSQARQCLGLLRGLALDIDCAIVLLSHPSLTGISSGSGLSGSTAWNNSVRSRLYLHTDKKDKGEDEATNENDIRVLELMKANYGPAGTQVRLRWHEGLLIREDHERATPMQQASVEERARQAFMVVLTRFDAYDSTRTLSPKKKANNYVTKIMVTQPEFKALVRPIHRREQMIEQAYAWALQNNKAVVVLGPQIARRAERHECLVRTSKNTIEQAELFGN